MKTKRTRRFAVVRVGAGSLLGGVALMALLAACGGKGSEQTTGPGAKPELTVATGSQSTLLGRAAFESFHVKRKAASWEMDVNAKDSVDVAVQSIVFQPGSQSGWHQHPGLVLIQVVTGTMTFYESDDPTCTPIVRTAGQGYVDAGEHAHLARNESGAPATNVVTYFAPHGAALRIDAPQPGNCPF